jgi:hypothetical protein
MVEINILKVRNLIKLLKEGKIDEVYNQIYAEAERIAIHETEQYEAEKLLDDMIDKNAEKEHVKNMFKYKRERIEYHTNKMIELLKFSKEKSEDKQD